MTSRIMKLMKMVDELKELKGLKKEELIKLKETIIVGLLQEDEHDDPDCICDPKGNSNPLCMEHQCCWKCSTEKEPIHLVIHSNLWLCQPCDDKGNWCRGCRKIINDDGFCSHDCMYGEDCGIIFYTPKNK